MRLVTCVALELVTGTAVALGLVFSVSWGLDEVNGHWPGEATAAETAIARATQPETSAPPAASATATPARAEPPVARIELDLSARTGALARAPVIDDSTAPDLVTVQPGSPEAATELDPHVAAIVQPTPEPVVPGASPEQSWRNAPYYRRFNGERDDVLLAPLRGSTIQKVKFNRGGSSISLRVEFANGARAAFKPQQTALQTIPRKEVAAYRIDRLLGLGSVPPAIPGQLDFEELIAAVEPSSQAFVPRLRAEMRVKGGKVSGELSWWIPIIKKATIGSYEIDSTNGIVTWKRYLTVGNDMPEEELDMLAQISNMVLFDFIINNPDRWSGSNARVSEDDTKLYFMDNTMSFLADADGHHKTRIYFQRAQKFSRTLVEAIRQLSESSVRAVLSWDHEPYDYLLSESEIKMLMKRRDYALAYIDGLIAEHGESAVLVFP